MRECFDILGVHIDVTNLEKASRTIGEWIDRRQKAYVCIAPVSTIMDCQRDSSYRDVVNNSQMTTPDGMPLVWLGKLKGKKDISRTYGPDLLQTLCELSEAKGYRHYFYGGNEKTNLLLIHRLKERFPHLNIAGSWAPPFRETGEREEESVLKKINDAQPDILWVGLGSPKQDFWMAQHRDPLNVPVMIGVGAAFDFLAGVKRQAPRWIQSAGLEWLFRLGCEPRRLWKRYLIGNTLFVYLLCLNWWQRHVHGKNPDVLNEVKL